MNRVLYPLALAVVLAAASPAVAGGVKSPWRLKLLESCKSPDFVEATQARAVGTR